MTIAFTDKHVHPFARPFYTMFPWEPVPEIKVDRVVEGNRITMEWLLQQIADTLHGGDNLFIIHHGTEAGLSIPLVADTPYSRIMEVLDSTHTDIEVAQLCIFNDPRGAGAQRAHALREHMRRVKDLRLNCVELRACNTGQNKPNMQIIKRFFNCRTLGAPDLRDSYFDLHPGAPTGNSSTWESWRRSHPRHRIFEVPANGRVGIAIQETAHSAFHTFMIVNNVSAPSFWTDVYLAFVQH